jgi:type IV pilus assembly protein PilA
MENSYKKGFTLLEVLLVVAVIAILAGIVILALNPAKQLAESRNANREVDVNTILNAIWQYSIDNDGTLPSGITTTAAEICNTGVAPATCTANGLVDLSVLTSGEEYLVSIPQDPTGASTNGAGYEIQSTAGGRITVSAPDAELSATISVTR